ncbi:hypothetical protein BN871_CZ_00180 [Paenibacillus sp. P22]|nr:hypothetical protein BN871_CZ_00180 [Paenibacillus sp. P22]
MMKASASSLLPIVHSCMASGKLAREVVDRDLRPMLQGCLVQNGSDVVGDRALGDEQLAGNFLVGQPLRDPGHDFELPLRKQAAVDRRLRCSSAGRAGCRATEAAPKEPACSGSAKSAPSVCRRHSPAPPLSAEKQKQLCHSIPLPRRGPETNAELSWLFCVAQVSAAPADPLKIKPVVQNGKTVLGFETLFQRSEPVVLDLLHGAALHANQMMMVMLAVVRSEIVTGYAVSEVHLLHDVKLAEKLKRAIDGGKADLGSLILDEHEHILGAEMILFILKQDANGRFALRGQLVALRLELLLNGINAGFHNSPLLQESRLAAGAYESIIVGKLLGSQ